MRVTRQGVFVMDRTVRLLAFGLNAWDGQWMNRQHLLSRIGRRFPVLYSTGGWFTWDRHSQHWRDASFFGSIRHADNVWVDMSPRYLLRFPRSAILDRWIVRRLASRWRRWAMAQGRGHTIAYLFHPAFAPYLDGIRPDKVVYHAYDLFDHTPGWTESMGQNEVQLLNRADLVIASSEPIAERLRKKVSRQIRVLPNGVDLESFEGARASGAQEPEDLSPIPHPRIAYVGSLHPQVDYGLVAALAQREPAWHFVFVGGKIAQRDAMAERELSVCEQLPNVHFLGVKHRSKVPYYTLNMDVNVLCYRLTDGYWVKAGYPLKLNEYLAAGRPVVSADLESVRPFAEVVQIATSPSAWYHALMEALTQGGVGTPETRRAIAEQNSWDRRSRLLESWLIQLVNATV